MITPTPAVSAFYYLLSLRNLADLATVLALPADAAAWTATYTNATGLYHKRFYNATAKGYATGSQTANIMALYAGAVPPALVPTVAASLVQDIVAARRGHTSCGIVGATFFFDVLTEIAERGDVALDVLLKDDFPSYGYMINQVCPCVEYF